MSDDKIAEIRARQKDGAPGQMPIAALCQCDADREFLLAEIDRLRRIKAMLDRNEREFIAAIGLVTTALLGPKHDPSNPIPSMKLVLDEVEKRTRERDDAGEWTANDVRSDEDWDEERNDAKTDDVFITRGQIRAARKALEAKP